jgi:hypothetical protein
MKGRGQAKGWDCEEWAHATPNLKKLPEHVDGDSEKKSAAEKQAAFRAAVVADMEKRAATPAQLMGVRAAAAVLGVPR